MSLQPLRSNEEAWQLAVANYPIINWAISRVLSKRGLNKWFSNDGTWEDAVQTSQLALFRACQLWDGRTATLPTYALRWIRNSLLLALRERLVGGTKIVKKDSPSYPAYYRSTNQMKELSVIIEDDRNSPHHLAYNEWVDESTEQLESAIVQLVPQQLKVISMVFRGMKLRAIAKELKVTPQRVWQLKERAKFNVGRILHESWRTQYLVSRESNV